MHKFSFDSVRKNALTKAAALVVSLAALAGTTQAATTHDHNKTVVGYITQWEPWKANTAGYPVQGAATHLNVDMSQYTILNFSFFGVAQDGSLHSGDFRNKQIYQVGQVQAPAPILYTDTYSSWDLYLLWGELDPQQYVSPGSQNETDLRAQGFTWTDTTWTHTASGLTGAYPIPKHKVGGKPGLIEQAHLNGVKVMASIGGWSMCKHYPEMAADANKRAKFMEGVRTLIGLGFDGIDIDWEYPGAAGMNIEHYSNADYGNFLILMQQIRATIGTGKLITAAFSADPAHLEGFNWTELDKVMDHYNFMTYDFNGGWSTIAGHNSPLYNYPGSEFPTFNWDSLATYITGKGVSRSKINMGFAFYGRGVVTQAPAAVNQTTIKTNVTVAPDGPVSTAADFTNWAQDVYDGTPNYFFIKQQSGWTDHWDDSAKVPYMTKDVGGRSYFLSYDNEQSIGLKAQYVNDHNLGGAIVWHVHGDFECVGGYTMAGKLAVCNGTNPILAKKINSVFATGGVASSSKSSVVSSKSSSSVVSSVVSSKSSSSVVSSVVSSKSSSSSIVSSSSSSVTSSVGSCNGIAAWNSATVYNLAGAQVSYNGVKYENKWWTQNEEPSTHDVWTNKGPCAVTSSSVASSVISSVASSKSSSSVVSSVASSKSSSSVVSSVASSKSSSSSSSTGSLCTSPAYIDKATYTDGAKVQNVGNEYQCKIGGWCTIGGPYAPGAGWAWDNAWTLVRACQ